MVAMMPPGMASTVAVVREKAPKKKVTRASLLDNFLPGAKTAAVGPASLGNKRDAWANALENMSGVYTGSPITAAAKVAGMGLAGWQQGKAAQEMEQGQQAFREKWAKALAGGVPDNETISGLMADPYAGDAGNAIMQLWARANPEPGEVKPNMVPLEYPNGTKFQVDLNTPEGAQMYNEFVQKAQNGGMAGGGGGTVKNPLDITKEVTGDKQYQANQVATSTLNSMYKSFSDRSAISDLDYIIGVAKILDPTSVVRTQEGEQVQATQALPAQLAGRMNQLMNGQATLDDKTRADLYRLAHRRVSELQAQVGQQNDFYSNMATENGYDPNTYVPAMPEMPQGSIGYDANMKPPPDWQPPAPGAPAPQPGSPPASAAPAPAPAPPSMPQPAPAPSESVQPVDPSLPPIPPALRQVPMLRQLWPQIVQDLDQPGEMEAFQRAIQSNPALLQRAYPEAFQSGVQQ